MSMMSTMPRVIDLPDSFDIFFGLAKVYKLLTKSSPNMHKMKTVCCACCADILCKRLLLLIIAYTNTYERERVIYEYIYSM